MSSLFKSWIVLTLLLAAVGAGALAQEPATEGTDERQQRLAAMKDQAAAYTLSLGKRGTTLALHDEPILRFSNPVSGVPDGIVAMWKDGQRPAVVAQGPAGPSRSSGMTSKSGACPSGSIRASRTTSITSGYTTPQNRSHS